MTKEIFFYFFIFSNILFAKDLNLAIATNVSFVIEDLKKEFLKENKNISINTSIASSGKLSAQIHNGAPYDVFMSANMFYTKNLYDKKIAITEPKVYAQGSLVLFSERQKDFHLGFEKLLKRPCIRTISIANPKTAPYGFAAKEVLEGKGIYEDVKQKLVYAQSISQTVAQILNASDIGIIAKSTLYSKNMKRFKENIHYINIDSIYHSPINQGIVLLKRAKNNKIAKKFYDFILSSKGQNILEKYGYETN